MEKVKVKSCTPKAFGDKTIFNIVLEDGRTGSSYNEEFSTALPNEEIEADVKPSGREFPKGTPTYYFNIAKKTDGKFKSFTPKDYTFEKRKAALEQAVLYTKESDLIAKDKDVVVLNRAEKFFTFLNQK